MTWRVRTTAQFDKALKKLDRAIAARIIANLERIADLDDPRSTGKALSGDLVGFWRYRVGDYRVLVQFRDDQLTIIAITVGHRSKVYR